jgi:hypothetical protein
LNQVDPIFGQHHKIAKRGQPIVIESGLDLPNLGNDSRCDLLVDPILDVINEPDVVRMRFIFLNVVNDDTRVVQVAF